MADQPIMTPGGLPYGQRKALEDQQRAAPLPKAGMAPGAAATRDASYRPPVVPLDAASHEPGTHVMDGVDIGPGRTAAQAGIPQHDDGSPEAVAAVIRGVYAATGNADILALLRALEGTDQGGGLADHRYVHGGWANDPIDPPQHGMQFDPGATLNQGQVDDTRKTSAAALAVQEGVALGAATSQVAAKNPSALVIPQDGGEPGEQTDTTADMYTDNPKLRMKGPR